MSPSKQFPLQQKKRKHVEVAEKVLSGLEQYKELSPASSRLRDKLLAMAKEAVDADDDADVSLLRGAFEFFELKQKQAEDAENERKSLSQEIKSLEAELQTTKEQYEHCKLEEQKAKADIDDFELLLEYGDWFGKSIASVKKGEHAIQEKDKQLSRAEYQDQNNANEQEAITNAKEEAEANGVEYTGLYTFHDVDPEKEAQREADFSALDRGRWVTSTQERVDAEKAKILQWQTGAQDEDTAPATPFLDRIQRLCSNSGITRPTLLSWIAEYGRRNEKCHHKPPQVEDYRKVVKNLDGNMVKVKLEPHDPTAGIDWVKFREAFAKHRSGLQARYAERRIDLKRRDAYMAAIDACWALYSVSEDGAGNRILTQYAKNVAGDIQQSQDMTKEPPENPPKRYKVGKWDDIIE
ncbi:uncharacterized protein FIESC28_07686 [Fusarium coffeatum]|uniref:Uncharacterized protein n=1 Tax=Fusarium coffeatum TaxID=231269 RepID=A0A366RDS1_9HYPO|nr:uncharacterized protein FIESC28_07686 [Fusarium coffeatum]RBR14450.1 hypothetical protein FIESC28_07686 [Fusarium coffeatum]